MTQSNNQTNMNNYILVNVPDSNKKRIINTKHISYITELNTKGVSIRMINGDRLECKSVEIEELIEYIEKTYGDVVDFT